MNLYKHNADYRELGFIAAFFQYSGGHYIHFTTDIWRVFNLINMLSRQSDESLDLIDSILDCCQQV
jgi:hypothetical protein